MKILSAEQIRNVDKSTIVEEEISSLTLMTRASSAFYEWFVNNYNLRSLSILVISGVGNNGGDGLVVAQQLAKAGYKVKVLIVEYSDNYSTDFIHNLDCVKAANIPLTILKLNDDLPELKDYDILIDAIFGTGLNRTPEGIATKVIQKMNVSGKPIISVDVPSGLFLDNKTTFAVKATETVTFQIPKLALFLPENSVFTGNVHIVPIGLSEKSISEEKTHMYFLEKTDISSIIKPLFNFTHKGIQGHALIIGGSIGKCGSVYLSAKAALKSGCGLVTTYVPKNCLPIIQNSFPESMAICDNSNDYISDITFNLKPDAIGVGVGLGQQEETQQAFYYFLKKNVKPLVIDADGLNILSRNPDWLKLVPGNSILTPHPKELLRLIGDWTDDFNKIQKSMQFAKKHACILVIKGAFTIIVDGDNLYVNSTGTPALATAGSGDVLTGIITSLMAQGYSSLEAAKTGIYLHGLTATITKQTINPRSFIASDIIDNIGNAYYELEK